LRCLAGLEHELLPLVVVCGLAGLDREKDKTAGIIGSRHIGKNLGFGREF
jgi:hypothetical protein